MRRTSGWSNVILLDKILLGAIILLMPLMVFLLYRSVRKDPRLRLTPKVWDTPRMWCREVWSFVEKLQPEENVGLLRRRKKREKDQRRE